MVYLLLPDYIIIGIANGGYTKSAILNHIFTAKLIPYLINAMFGCLIYTFMFKKK